jgi:hypothetical protein
MVAPAGRVQARSGRQRLGRSGGVVMMQVIAALGTKREWAADSSAKSGRPSSRSRAVLKRSNRPPLDPGLRFTGQSDG